MHAVQKFGPVDIQRAHLPVGARHAEAFGAVTAEADFAWYLGCRLALTVALPVAQRLVALRRLRRRCCAFAPPMPSAAAQTTIAMVRATML